MTGKERKPHARTHGRVWDGTAPMDSLLLVIGMFWRKHQSHQRREHGEDIAID